MFKIFIIEMIFAFLTVTLKTFNGGGAANNDGAENVGCLIPPHKLFWQLFYSNLLIFSALT